MREEINPVGEFYMEPAIEWMINQTPKNAIFMNSNPTIYAWLANRQVVTVRNLNVAQLYKVINDFQVDYFILDPGCYQYLPEIYNSVKNNWTCPLPGFSLVFYQQYFSDIPEVLIYDVSGCQNFKAENWTWKDEMLNSSDWHLYSGVGSYEWKFENGILNMSMTFSSPQDEYLLLQRELPTDNSLKYPSTLKFKFKVYGQAPQFTIDVFDSNRKWLGRIIDYRQTTDWRILESSIPSNTDYITVSISDMPDSCASGTLTVLVDWIEITGFHE
jgi:hypothetical protein